MLTDRAIKALTPREKQYKKADARRLSLIVRLDGARWWRFKYKRAGRENLLSLGVYPTVTLARSATSCFERWLAAKIRATSARRGSRNRRRRRSGPHLATKASLQLPALLFPRPGELRLAKWREIDFVNALWSIPAERMKMRREHIVPLSKQAMKILESGPHRRTMSRAAGYSSGSEGIDQSVRTH
jgi:integrase